MQAAGTLACSSGTRCRTRFVNVRTMFDGGVGGLFDVRRAARCRSANAHRSRGGTPQRDPHGRRTPRADGSNGDARREQGDCSARFRLPDLADGKQRPGIGRARHRRLRDAAPQQKVCSSRLPSPNARAPSRAGAPKRGDEKNSTIICLDICRSREAPSGARERVRCHRPGGRPPDRLLLRGLGRVRSQELHRLPSSPLLSMSGENSRLTIAGCL